MKELTDEEAIESESNRSGLILNQGKEKPGYDSLFSGRTELLPKEPDPAAAEAQLALDLSRWENIGLAASYMTVGFCEGTLGD